MIAAEVEAKNQRDDNFPTFHPLKKDDPMIDVYYIYISKNFVYYKDLAVRSIVPNDQFSTDAEKTDIYF